VFAHAHRKRLRERRRDTLAATARGFFFDTLVEDARTSSKLRRRRSDCMRSIGNDQSASSHAFVTYVCTATRTNSTQRRIIAAPASTRARSAASNRSRRRARSAATPMRRHARARPPATDANARPMQLAGSTPAATKKARQWRAFRMRSSRIDHRGFPAAATPTMRRDQSSSLSSSSAYASGSSSSSCSSARLSGLITKIQPSP